MDAETNAVSLERDGAETPRPAVEGGRVINGPAPRLIVGIGASAGGLEALERLFERMPADTGLAFVVVQHLSPDFKSLTDELLARRTTIPIRQAENAMQVEPDCIYLLPPRKDMILAEGRLLLTDKDPAQLMTLPIDQFFRSLAQDAGRSAVGVVLSGTGSDGSRGIRDIHAAGGLVVVQSPETARFDGMPRSSLATGIVDLVVAPEEVPAALLRHICHPLAGTVDAPSEPPPVTGMDAVFRLLREAYGIDFSFYKADTVTRRTERRLALQRSMSLDEYARQLAEDPEELNHLYRDLLIGVTGFFRDPEAFHLIQQQVLALLRSRSHPTDEFRVWVAGCATGEEAYSIGIVVQECLEALHVSADIKVFATDVHRASLDQAGAGIYSAASVAGVGHERLERWFVRKGDTLLVRPEIRRMIVFARHNVIKDAPFTKLDLITCRNMLIYFQPTAQKKVLSMFHFGLKTGGVLFLGPSEGPGELADEFETLDTRWKIYRKRRDIRLPADVRLSVPLTPERPRLQTALPVPNLAGTSDGQLMALLDALLDESMPPSLLVNERRELVRSFAGAGRFLRIRDAWLSTDVLDMVDAELRTALAGALPRAFKDSTPIAYRGLRVRTSDGECSVNLTVKPIHPTRTSARYALIHLEEVNASVTPTHTAKDLDLAEASQQQVTSLESELRSTKENLQAMIEELETSNEELQATNEELIAANEELQSTNEELHSVNEELYTVNAEYQKKISELTELTADLDNLLLSTQVHTMFLDHKLCIRKFTASITSTFNLLPQDVGRRIDSFTHELEHPGLLDDLMSVLETDTMIERQVRDRRGDWYLLRILPYRVSSITSGIVVTLVGINRIKQAEAAARWKDQQLTGILRNSPNWIFVKDLDGRYVLADDTFRRVVECDPIGKTSHEVFPARVADAVVAQDREVLSRRQAVMAEVPFEQDGAVHTYLSITFPIFDEQSKLVALGGIRTDVTALKQAEASAREALEQRDRFLAMLSHELRNPLAAILNATSFVRRLGPPSDLANDAFGVIERRSRHMARLLDDLLDVTRITQGKIEIRHTVFDLNSLAGDALEEVRPWIAERDLQLEIQQADELLLVRGDPHRLQQIQVNLLMNAAKYTPEGGRITYSIQRVGDNAVIQVTDTGVGMTEEMTRRAFDLFVQADETLARSSGGIGVGLTLVRSIVELHGGRVSCRSDGVGKGSEFTVIIPLAPKAVVDAHVAQVPEPLPPALDAHRLHVLVIEDDDDIRRSMAELLKLSGCEVIAVCDAGQALESLATSVPDAALIDIGLPGMDGYELARAIRERHPNAHIRLIALTGYGQPEDRKAAFRAGFDLHLTKPFHPDDLLRVLTHEPGGARPAGLHEQPPGDE